MVPKGQIRLLVQAGTDVVEVDFIVVDFFLLIQPSWADLGYTPWKLFHPPFIRR